MAAELMFCNTFELFNSRQKQNIETAGHIHLILLTLLADMRKKKQEKTPNKYKHTHLPRHNYGFGHEYFIAIQKETKEASANIHRPL